MCTVRGLFFLCLMVLQFPAMAQEDLTITKRKAQFKMMLTFDFRRTWVNAEAVGFYGMRIGAQKNKDIIALGFYGLSTPFIQPEVDLGNALGVRKLRTQFDFTTLTYERILMDTRRWQLGLPVGVGLGNYRTSYRTDEGDYRAYTTNELVPVDASLYLNYKITWWGFIGIGGGYRYVYAYDRNISNNLSDWTWFAKAGLRFGAIYKRIKGIPEEE
jgi:hypothetical protein